ncbi:MAG TPA: hypothetical protein GXZ47_09280 [Treponema sp.]|nr:hypothetical protein [Treponema sp.]
MSKKAKIDLLTVILLGIAAIILLVIVAGTLWAFSGRNVRSRFGDTPSSRERSLFSGGVKNPSEESLLNTDALGDTSVFPDIGTLRAVTADSSPVTVVLTVYFPYSAADYAFQEELVKKNRAIRRVILEWFRFRTISEVDALGEARVKAALLTAINETLVLGHIDVLYFSDYLVIE